jgi:hypothetical protein
MTSYHLNTDNYDKKNSTEHFVTLISSFYLSIFIPLTPTWSTGHPWNASSHFSFLILVSRYNSLDGGSGLRKAATYTGQHKRRQTSMPWVGFEPTIPVFHRAKTFYTLDLAATVIGQFRLCCTTLLQNSNTTARFNIFDLAYCLW